MSATAAPMAKTADRTAKPPKAADARAARLAAALRANLKRRKAQVKLRAARADIAPVEK